ncbi:MAG: hypothetical protein JW759_06515 [Candidatus Coatesbacteria bacterium]|nr:hypothetical protein [Candidatus Coatesbacteria bacterium]
MVIEMVIEGCYDNRSINHPAAIEPMTITPKYLAERRSILDGSFVAVAETTTEIANER